MIAFRAASTPGKPNARRRWLARAGAALFLPAVAAAGTAQATVVHDESVSGDLSNSGAAPTSILFAAGDNHVLGSTGRGTDGIVDRDYFTFTLLPDHWLSALEVLPGTTSIGPATVSFLAIQAGPLVTVDPNAPSAGDLLGWRHYGPGDIGSDILPLVGAGAGAQGFAPPLSPGTYAVWIQETGTGSASYGLNFKVAAVPEPATWLMMLLGFGLLGGALRAARRQPKSSNRPIPPRRFECRH